MTAGCRDILSGSKHYARHRIERQAPRITALYGFFQKIVKFAFWLNLTSVSV